VQVPRHAAAGERGDGARGGRRLGAVERAPHLAPREPRLQRARLRRRRDARDRAVPDPYAHAHNTDTIQISTYAVWTHLTMNRTLRIKNKYGSLTRNKFLIKCHYFEIT
jgi:hypothetical protein